jgi:hypothetical protein
MTETRYTIAETDGLPPSSGIRGRTRTGVESGKESRRLPVLDAASSARGVQNNPKNLNHPKTRRGDWPDDGIDTDTEKTEASEPFKRGSS